MLKILWIIKTLLFILSNNNRYTGGAEIKKMTKTIEVVYENGVFKPLRKVELKLKEGEEREIRIEDEEAVTRKIKTSLREYNDFLPRDFNFTLEKLRTDSKDRFKRLRIIP